jgi:RimJ/RimL family protein N-acetyltransferase
MPIERAAGRVLRPRYPIETERLTLRPFTRDDVDGLYAMQSLPEVARYLYWEPRERGEVKLVLDRKLGQSQLHREGDILALAVEERSGTWGGVTAAEPERSRRDAGVLVGEVSLTWLNVADRQGEIGFVFHPAYQGKGLAREAVEALLRLAFEEFGLHRIIGRCDPRNRPSARLLERLGMRHEAHRVHCEIFKGEWGDVDVYAILDTEWARNHSST